MEMKKVIVFAIAMLMASVSYGQHMRMADAALDKRVLAVSVEGAALATLEMQTELELKAEQLARIEQLNQERYNQIQELDALYKDEPLLRSKALYSLHLKNDKALENMLTSEQLRHYLELEGRANLSYVCEQEEE